MVRIQLNNRSFMASVAACLILWVLCGCANLGPSSLSSGRANYIEAINKTEDEQILLRHCQRPVRGDLFPAFPSVVSLQMFAIKTNAGVNVGYGPSEAYERNLVPFSGGVVYEENPTITYAPVQGAQYLRQLMSPIPLDILVLVIRSSSGTTHFTAPITMLANRINDMQNPGFIKTHSDVPDHRFQRFSELNTELAQAGVIQWVVDPNKDVPFDILITGFAPVYLEKVREYLALLEVTMPADASTDIVLPVRLGIKGRELNGIAISTRSTFDLVEISRAAIEIPRSMFLRG